MRGVCWGSVVCSEALANIDHRGCVSRVIYELWEDEEVPALQPLPLSSHIQGSQGLGFRVKVVGPVSSIVTCGEARKHARCLKGVGALLQMK